MYQTLRTEHQCGRKRGSAWVYKQKGTWYTQQKSCYAAISRSIDIAISIDLVVIYIARSIDLDQYIYIYNHNPVWDIKIHCSVLDAIVIFLCFVFHSFSFHY